MLQELQKILEKKQTQRKLMKASKPYFSHDIAAKSDEKIIRLMFDFRKNKNEFSENTLKELVAHAAYGIYWEIIEYLHENSLNIQEVEMLADELRIDADILKRILDNYELFKISEDKYISERVLRNLKLQEEKSEKARQSANQRHNRNRKREAAPEQEADKKEELPDYNEEFVMSIIQIYNEKFKKSQIVSKANKEKIFKIHSENNLSIEIWEKIFSNAKRGWDIGDKKNVAPSLKKILEEWDSFASDDYFLAPDREALEKLREKEEQEKRKEAEKRKIEDEKFNRERQQKYDAISSKEDALDFMYQYLPPSSKRFVSRSMTFKELSKVYSITVEEAVNYFNSRGER